MDTVLHFGAETSTPGNQACFEGKGRLIFVEHGHSPDHGVANWQDKLTPLWKRITGGCHLNRKIDGLIMSAGFHISKLETRYLPGPRPMTYTYQGVADPLLQ